MKKMILDKDLRDKLAMNAQKKVCEKFALQKVVSQTEEILLNI